MTTALATYAGAPAIVHTIALNTIAAPTAGRDVFVLASGANGLPVVDPPWSRIALAGEFHELALYQLPAVSNDGTILSLELTYEIAAGRTMSAVVWEDQVDGAVLIAESNTANVLVAATSIPIAGSPVEVAQSYDLLLLMAGANRASGITVPDETGWTGAATPFMDSGELASGNLTESSRTFLGRAVDPGPISGFSPSLELSLPIVGAGAGLVVLYDVVDVAPPPVQEDFDPPTAARTTAAENALTGDDVSVWRDAGAGDTSRCAFVRSYDLDVGAATTPAERTFDLCVDAADGSIADWYRLGWYGGTRSRRVARTPVTPSLQPDPATISDSNGATECSAWATSGTYVLPEFASPGLYVARVLNPAGTAGFLAKCVVADSSRQVDVLILHSSNTSVAAYNYYGDRASPLTGDSLYGAGGPLGNITIRKTAQSYQRPVVTDVGVRQTSIWGTESAFAAWCERQGFETGYVSDRQLHEGFITTLATAGRLPKVLALVGHPEYWSDEMRAQLAVARAAGVHILVVGANELYWRVRFDPADRDVMICYKDTQTLAGVSAGGVAKDPVTWTGTWRDSRRVGGALLAESRDGEVDGTLLAGTRSFFEKNYDPVADDYLDAAIVAATYGGHPMWRGTSVDTSGGAGADLAIPDAIGFEADVPHPAPGDSFLLAGATTVNISGVFMDDFGDDGTLTDADVAGGEGVIVGIVGPYPSTGLADLEWGIICQWQAEADGAGTPDGGSLLVDVGTNNWGALLDDDHWRFGTAGSLVQQPVQQATVNVLADMGVAAATLQGDLTAPTPVEPQTLAGLDAQTLAGTDVVVELYQWAAGGAAPDATPELSLTWRPYAPRLGLVPIDEGELASRPTTVAITGSPQTIAGVTPTPVGDAWVWEVVERGVGPARVRYLRVPTSATPVRYGDLVEVDPRDL